MLRCSFLIHGSKASLLRTTGICKPILLAHLSCFVFLVVLGRRFSSDVVADDGYGFCLEGFCRDVR